MENKVRASGVGMICSVCPPEWEVTAFYHVAGKGYCELCKAHAVAAATAQSKGYGMTYTDHRSTALSEGRWSMTQGVKKDGKAMRAR
jgi:hypothetical protein